mmetsp:Transcript_4299/g.3607  ORF Transcript_4299/g.3607 Transcript_4299/m.3607 type:complete len:131 (+) Transcript_4299:67-459(+)
MITIEYLGIGFKKKTLNFFTNEQKKLWYKAINPKSAVLTLKDTDGFCTNERLNIVKYMIESRQVDTDLYPLHDMKKRMKIDQAIEFVIEEYRRRLMNILINTVFNPPFLGEPMPTKQVYNQYIDNMNNSL